MRSGTHPECLHRGDDSREFPSYIRQILSTPTTTTVTVSMVGYFQHENSFQDNVIFYLLDLNVVIIVFSRLCSLFHILKIILNYFQFLHYNNTVNNSPTPRYDCFIYIHNYMSVGTTIIVGRRLSLFPGLYLVGGGGSLAYNYKKEHILYFTKFVALYSKHIEEHN